MKKTILSVFLILLLGVGTGLCDDAPLTSLDSANALSDIRASRGVVFVDLYADW